MKIQLLAVVLLFSVIISSAFAQSRNQLTSPVIPEHPLVKTLKLLQIGDNQPYALKTVNQNFQLNELESQVWNEDEWLPYLKTENSYQSGNRVESRGYFLPDPVADWELSSKNIFTYENDNLTSHILQGISESETITQERTLYTYEQFGGNSFIKMVVYQMWDSSEDEWINEYRSLITLENGKISEVIDEIWVNDQWELDERYRYEESEGDIIETSQLYDTLLENWVNTEQYIYSDITLTELYNILIDFTEYVEDGRSYLIIGMLPDYTSYEWDEAEESWIAFDRQMTSESSNFKNDATTAISILMEEFDLDIEEWVADFEYILGYADNGNPVNFSFYAAEEGTMMYMYAEDYNYDENNLMEMILQYGNLFGEPYKLLNDELSLVGRILLNWGEVSTSIDRGTDPYTFRLNAAYPNPFNPSTVIPFQLATPSNVTIRVYDMLGRNVTTLVNEFRPSGDHSVRFDGSGLSSGVYMIRMVAPGLHQTRSVTLLK